MMLKSNFAIFLRWGIMLQNIVTKHNMDLIEVYKYRHLTAPTRNYFSVDCVKYMYYYYLYTIFGGISKSLF
jgi:hypothetical protein